MNKPEILIVEDDKAIKNLISTTLEMEGYRYHTAENGAQAILSAATQQPDIMLLDLGLPDMDGVQVIAKVRTWSQMPIIVISARSEDRDKIEALDAGADDYLTKPFRQAARHPAPPPVPLRLHRSRKRNLHQRRPHHRFRRWLRLPGRKRTAPDPLRVQTPLPPGPPRRQSPDPLLHHQGNLGQLLGRRRGLPAGVHGFAAQKNRGRPQPATVHTDPCGGGVSDDSGGIVIPVTKR